MQLTLYTSDFTGKESNTIYPHKIKVKDSASFLSAITKDHDLARIKERFPVRELKSSQDIQDWNAGYIPIAVIHPASAGHGKRNLPTLWSKNE